jgi:hypothetical protein
MTRRHLLALLTGSATVDPERLLWTPGKRLISVPTPPIVYRVSGGTWISIACQRACSIAKKNNQRVEFNFNDTLLTAYPFSTPLFLESLFVRDRWDRELWGDL